jgi:hypothetical protein
MWWVKKPFEEKGNLKGTKQECKYDDWEEKRIRSLKNSHLAIEKPRMSISSRLHKQSVICGALITYKRSWQKIKRKPKVRLR